MKQSTLMQYYGKKVKSQTITGDQHHLQGSLDEGGQIHGDQQGPSHPKSVLETPNKRAGNNIGVTEKRKKVGKWLEKARESREQKDPDHQDVKSSKAGLKRPRVWAGRGRPEVTKVTMKKEPESSNGDVGPEDPGRDTEGSNRPTFQI